MRKLPLLAAIGVGLMLGQARAAGPPSQGGYAVNLGTAPYGAATFVPSYLPMWIDPSDTSVNAFGLPRAVSPTSPLPVSSTPAPNSPGSGTGTPSYSDVQNFDGTAINGTDPASATFNITGVSGNIITAAAPSVGAIVPGMALSNGATILAIGTSGTTGRALAGTYATSGGALAVGSVTGTLAPSVVGAAALAAWQAARAAYPNTLIFVLGVWPGVRNQATSTLQTEAAIAASFATWGDANSYYIPVNADPVPWITGTGNSASPNGTGNADLYMASDNTHPNDAGNAHIAGRAANGMRSIIAGF